MHYNDHPPPHFHVRYAGQKAMIELEGLAVLKGRLSPKALSLVVEWAAQHQQELHDNWERARRQAPLDRIDPLE